MLEDSSLDIIVGPSAAGVIAADAIAGGRRGHRSDVDGNLRITALVNCWLAQAKA